MNPPRRRRDPSTGPGRSSLSIGERLCAACVPLIVIVEVLAVSFFGCFGSPPRARSPRHRRLDELAAIAAGTIFTVNEIEALFELFKKISSSIIDDGLIHKEELQKVLFNTPSGENLFLDRVFDIFDEKKNGVIEFEEFIHALDVFHPHASKEKKIDFAFRLYDLKGTGYIERDDVREMVIASLKESNMKLSNDQLEKLIDDTFADADVDKDGKISKYEWRDFVLRHPTHLRNMTLHRLSDISTAFPSFIFYTEVED